MSLLEKLPGEVLSEAAGFLDSEALLTFRLVNKNISNTMDYVFLRRFFRHRNVFINNDSLENLRQISLSEKYRTSVASLAVCIHHIPEARYDFEFEDMSSQARTMAESNDPQYTMLLRDQKWLMESGQAAAHLALALSNLPNCTAVEVNDQVDYSIRPFQKSKASQLLTTRMTLSASVDFVMQLISTTMAAINASGCLLEAFSIVHVVEGIGTRQLPRLSSGQLSLPFSKLPSLELIVGLKYNHDQHDWVACLFDLFKLFPFLKDLDMGFNERLTRAQFSSFGRGLHVEGMTTFALGCVDCYYEDLAVLLKSHRDTLRSIMLDAVDLTGGVKSWRSVLELIRNETLIDSIDLTYCTSDDKDISFGADFEKGQMSVPTESHRFREELDVIIRAL